VGSAGTVWAHGTGIAVRHHGAAAEGDLARCSAAPAPGTNTLTMSLLPETRITEIHRAALDLALDRMTLLGAVERHFVESIPITADRAQQTLTDLHHMNRAGRLKDLSWPLQQWLEAATTLAVNRFEQVAFTAALADLEAGPLSEALPLDRAAVAPVPRDQDEAGAAAPPVQHSRPPRPGLFMNNPAPTLRALFLDLFSVGELRIFARDFGGKPLVDAVEWRGPALEVAGALAESLDRMGLVGEPLFCALRAERERRWPAIVVAATACGVNLGGGGTRT
jgi:hypothetical protein